LAEGRALKRWGGADGDCDSVKGHLPGVTFMIFKLSTSSRLGLALPLQRSLDLKLSRENEIMV